MQSPSNLRPSSEKLGGQLRPNRPPWTGFEIESLDQSCVHCGAAVNLTTRKESKPAKAASNSERESISDETSKLSALHRQGSLAAKEFEGLKERVRSARLDADSGDARANRSEISPARDRTHSYLSSLILPSLIVGLIWLDHARGPLFPDEWYCAIGAGTAVREAGYTTTDSWSANNGCGASIRGCETGWSHVPARAYCRHSSIWNEIRYSRRVVNGFGFK
jgi:hypothetical protein